MLAAFVVGNQTVIAYRYLTIKAIILEILRCMYIAVQGFVYNQRFVSVRSLLQVLQLDNFVVFKTTHIFVSVVTTAAQEIGTIIATGNCILLALTRSTIQLFRLNSGQVQNIGKYVITCQRLHAIRSNL